MYTRVGLAPPPPPGGVCRGPGGVIWGAQGGYGGGGGGGGVWKPSGMVIRDVFAIVTADTIQSYPMFGLPISLIPLIALSTECLHSLLWNMNVRNIHSLTSYCYQTSFYEYLPAEMSIKVFCSIRIFPSYSEIFTQIYIQGGNYWHSVSGIEIQ